MTGTPGIGTSVFLHYFLWILITKQTDINKENDRNIYFQDSTHGILSFQGNKCVYYNSLVADHILSNDPNCILLVDMVEEQEPFTCRGTVIVFSNPDEVRYRHLMKNMYCKLWFNVWTIQEIRDLWEHSYQHVTWKNVWEVFLMMGGMVRYVLEQNNAADVKFGEGINRTKLQITCYAEILNTDSYTYVYRILHRYSPDHSDEKKEIVFASSFARRMCLEGLTNRDHIRLFTFLKNNTARNSITYEKYVSDIQATIEKSG